MMKISFAPMEGITGSVYRTLHKKHFEGIDDYDGLIHIDRKEG